jgi:hypothetical protein
MGGLDAASFVLGPDGWQATWRVPVDIDGWLCVEFKASTNTYTLLHSGVASTLDTALTATPDLGLVYNNTNFTVGGKTNPINKKLSHRFTRKGSSKQVLVVAL